MPYHRPTSVSGWVGRGERLAEVIRGHGLDRKPGCWHLPIRFSKHLWVESRNPVEVFPPSPLSRKCDGRTKRSSAKAPRRLSAVDSNPQIQSRLTAKCDTAI